LLLLLLLLLFLLLCSLAPAPSPHYFNWHLLSRSLAAAAAAAAAPPPPLLTALLYLTFHLFFADTKLVANAVGTLINYGSLLEEGRRDRSSAQELFDLALSVDPAQVPDIYI